MGLRPTLPPADHPEDGLATERLRAVVWPDGALLEGATRGSRDRHRGRRWSISPWSRVRGREHADRGLPPAASAAALMETPWRASRDDPTGAGAPATATRPARSTPATSTGRSTPRPGSIPSPRP